MDVMGKRIVVVVAVLLVLVFVFFLYMGRRGGKRGVLPEEEKAVVTETRSVTLFFAGREADALLSESHEVPVHGGLAEQMRAVVEEFLMGPTTQKAVSAIPRGTRLLDLFWDEESQTIYLDFSQAFVSNHPGGSTAEYYTITTLLKTIQANFPQVRRVQFLVEGYPVETIAGHYSVKKPIEIDRWR